MNTFAMGMFTTIVLSLTAQFVSTLSYIPKELDSVLATSTYTKPTADTLQAVLVQPFALVSPSDQISDQCSNHIHHYLNNLANYTDWAINMFDSSTKLPSGVVTGNTLNMGNYDQCVSVAVNDGDDVHFLGQHCTVSVQFTLAADSCTNFAGGDMCNLIVAIAAAAGLKNWHSRTTVPYHWSYCVPSTCTPSEVNAALSDAFKGLAVPGRVDVTVSVPSYKCLTLGSVRRDFTTADYTFIVTMAIFAVLLTVGTSCDIYMSTRESTEKTTSKFQMALRAFSVYSNGRELVSTRSAGGTMTSLNGLRFLSICWIIFGHTFYQMSAGPQMNGLDISHYKYRWGMMLVMNATLGTDSFFLLSGALLCYIFMRDRRKTSHFNIATFYLHRYIRLTPPYAAVVFFYATMFYHVGSGPLWDTWVGVNRDNCVLNWWANLLYINNYVDVANICMSHSWYLSVDMQLFWVSPVIVYPLWKWPRVGQCVLGVALVASVAAPLMVTAVNQLAGAMLYTTNDLMVGQVYIEVYSRMYTRAGPYLIGIALGYLLHHTGDNKLKLSKMMVVVGWCVCTTSLLAVLFGVFGMYQDDHVYNTVEASVYAGFHRTVWALCVAWILFACVNGYGGPVDAVLSCQLLQPLSRLTYCAYLCHFTFLLLNTGLTKTTGYITVYTVIREYLGNMVLTLVTAAALSLTFEIPFLILDKNFLTRIPGAAASKPLTRDQARASVEAYISRDPEKNVLQDAEKHVESTATGSRVEELKSYTNRGFHH